MRKPFEKLVRELADSEPEDVKANLTIGQLAARHGCNSERILDALDTIRMFCGERTYISANMSDA